MKKLLALTVLLGAGLSQAATLDFRLSYDGIAKDYTGRAFISNAWGNGVGGSLEAPFAMTSTKYSGDFDQLKTGTNEGVAWWTYRPSPEWFVRPGVGLQINSSGSTTRPFVTVGRKMNDQWDVSFRYRHGHRNYDTKDLAGNMSRDSAHNLTLWNGYKVNPNLTLEYQLDYISKVNNFANDNKKKGIFEHELVALFPDGFGKGVTPYVLINHLGKSYGTEDKSGKDHWRPRVGIKISF